MHLAEGNYDYTRIFSILNHSCDLAVETKKDSLENLDDFNLDVRFLDAY